MKKAPRRTAKAFSPSSKALYIYKNLIAMDDAIMSMSRKYFLLLCLFYLTESKFS